jgi:selenocysteine lyase/cysteine desulfurase
MVTRRELMGMAAASVAWPALRAEASQGLPAPPPAGGPADETFWTSVRSRFELPADRANFVTVVRGVSTASTRQTIVSDAARENTFRPAANPMWKQEVRQKAGRFIGAPADSVALVRNTTEGVTTVLLNWPLERGDEILTSSTEHGPFYDTLAQRAARDGVTIRRFHYPAPARSLNEIVDAIDRALSPRTRLVMIGQVVLTGQINPVRAIADRVHARGAKLLVDGVLGLGHIPVDVQAMDCDFYAAGFHKWGCGPRATAVFYVRPGLVERLPSLFGSATEDDQGRPILRWNSPQIIKYESFGAHPQPHFFALGDSIDFLSSLGAERIRSRLFFLTARWMERAQRVKGFRAAVTLDPAQCAGLVAWELDGRERARVRQLFTDRAVPLLVGGTESYAGFFDIPEDRPRSLFVANVGVFTSPQDVDSLAEAIEAAWR